MLQFNGEWRYDSPGPVMCWPLTSAWYDLQDQKLIRFSKYTCLLQCPRKQFSHLDGIGTFPGLTSLLLSVAGEDQLKGEAERKVDMMSLDIPIRSVG